MDWLVKLIPHPLKWAKDLVGSGDPRVHAVIALVIVATLCRCAILLCRAAYSGRNVDVALTVVVGALTTIVTIIYNIGKKAEAPSDPPK